MAKVGDKYILHSINGMDYSIKVVNVNNYREPSLKYGIDVCDSNGVYAGDVMFVGDDFLSKCEKVNRTEKCKHVNDNGICLKGVSSCGHCIRHCSYFET